MIAKLEEAKKVKEIKDDNDMAEKTNKIVEKLKSYSKSTITDDILLTVMRTQQLIKEIHNDGNHG